MQTGERHPLAVLSDHEVELVRKMCEERDALIASMPNACPFELHQALRNAGLSLSKLAEKFEISKSSVWDMLQHRRR